MSHNISATVTIQYGGNKAVNILATKNHVTEDLLDLKLPRSKTENIVITPPSSVTLIWDSVAKNGVLHKHLLARTSRSHLALIREQLDHLEIVDITMTESDVDASSQERYHPYTRPALSHGSPPRLSEKLSSDVVTSLPTISPSSSVKQEPLDYPMSSSTATLLGRHSLEDPKPFSDEINSITRDLWDVRRELSASLAREHSLLLRLERLNVSVAEDFWSTQDSHLLRGRLRLAERQFSEERQKRIEAENILEDIAKERAEPFIVPALLDAFVAISKLSTEVEPPT